MLPPSDLQVTHLLRRWSAGDADALAELLPVLYGSLHELAHQRMRGEAAAHTLNTTGLVHEAYLRLADGAGVSVQDRKHFLAIAARVMRNVLVDHARARQAAKRGGGATPVELRQDLWVQQIDLDAVQELDEALRRLEALEPRQSVILEQHYFGGLSLEETADVLGLSLSTVKRELRAARAWLALQLAPEAS
ncbi:MAG TPA: ECF-type sigma factor [Longimicrobiales bacterium]